MVIEVFLLRGWADSGRPPGEPSPHASVLPHPDALGCDGAILHGAAGVSAVSLPRSNSGLRCQIRRELTTVWT